MKLTVGSRWKSAVCTTQVIVLQSARDSASLECGGHPMIALDSERVGETLDPRFAYGSAVGKRLVTADEDIEVLITKPGQGSLSVDGVALVLKQAKPLPSSD
ncbi:MAG: hypothetical protein QOC57_2328 [Ilumatobacteraceae bacterium]|jgi:hypothetical protein